MPSPTRPRLAPAALALVLCAAPAAALEVPFLSGWFQRDASAEQRTDNVGTREWWAKHRREAVHVPGEGYRVEGYEGYFDANGQPMDAAVDEIAIKLTRDAPTGGGLLPGLDPKAAANHVRDAVGMGPDQLQARRFFEEGLAFMRQEKYGRAAARFKRAAERWPGSDLAAKALFNRAEANFQEKDYDEAADVYVELLDKHPSTPRLNDAVERLWSIAQYWEKSHFSEANTAPMGINLTEKTRPTLDTIGHAVRLYEAIRLNDPTGPRADDAIMATAGIYFRQRRFSDADYHYTLLRSEYPRSELQFEAHLLGLQAKLEKYYGPDYDGTPLEEAKRLEEQTRINFTGRLDEEELERLAQTRAKLAASIEARDLRMAEYYEGIEHHASARIYLAKVIEEHPDSPGAAEARERLAKLEGLPDEPGVPMEWFVNMFPENKKFKSINTLQELAPDADMTRVAEQPGEDATTTR